MEFLHRKDAGSDKCPRCSRTGVDFVVVQEGVLGCFDCGCLFLRKSHRIKAVLVSVVDTAPDVQTPVIVEEVPEFTCDICGKVCKSKLGWSSHMRSHKNG